jgi:hypothetical protein
MKVGRCDHSIMAATLKPSAKESDLVKPQKKLQHATETAVALGENRTASSARDLHAL